MTNSMSMTGFGRGEFSLAERSYRVELRSYNNRFLDVKVRIPWTDGALEARILSSIRQRIHRGRLEVAVREEVAAVGALSPQLNEQLARELAPVLGRLGELLGCDLSTAARLVPPLRELVAFGAELAGDQIWPQMEPGLERALDQLMEMKRREGEALARDLERHLDRLEQLVGEIQEMAAGEPGRLRDKLEERLRDLDLAHPAIDPERLAQEVALLADRHDISEELARFDSHTGQLRQILSQPGAMGRKLEFMLQELHRELNTISAKSVNAGIAHRVVEGKGCLEKMREQAQNVE